MSIGSVWVLVPLKEPELAKSRLAPVLAPGARKRLFVLMARQVIRAARAAAGVAGVAVVTASAEVARFAEAEGARILPDRAQAGFAEACRDALPVLARDGVGSVLILPGDLPLASAAEISRITAGAGRSPAVTLVPDERRDGTNALFMEPLGIIPLAFGPGSFAAHAEAARRAGARLDIIESAVLALDIDGAADYERLRARVAADEGLALDPALKEFFRETNPPPSDG